MLEEILENAKKYEITQEEALYLFRETKTSDKMLQLFQSVHLKQQTKSCSEMQGQEIVLRKEIKLAETIGQTL